MAQAPKSQQRATARHVITVRAIPSGVQIYVARSGAIKQVFDRGNYVGRAPVEIGQGADILYIGAQKAADEADRTIGTALPKQTVAQADYHLFFAVRDGFISCSPSNLHVPGELESLIESDWAQRKQFVNPYSFDPGAMQIQFVIENWKVTAIRKVYDLGDLRERQKIVITFPREARRGGRRGPASSDQKKKASQAGKRQ
jgi:hypothetical protein